MNTLSQRCIRLFRNKILLLSIIVSVFTLCSAAQPLPDKEEALKKERWSLHLNTGIRMLTDLNAGPVIGLSLHSPNKRWVLAFRNDFLLTIGKPQYALDTIDDPNQIYFIDNFVSEQKFSVIKFISYRYFEVDFSPFK